jgi:hypothetical protein
LPANPLCKKFAPLEVTCENRSFSRPLPFATSEIPNSPP